MNDRIETLTGLDLIFGSKLAIQLLSVIVAHVIVSESVRLSLSFISFFEHSFVEIEKYI